MLVCRSYSLPVKDRGGRTWEFVIKSWANGTENRRVYVLEQTGEYLKVIAFVLPTLPVLRLYCFAVRSAFLASGAQVALRCCALSIPGKWSSSVLRRCSVQCSHADAVACTCLLWAPVMRLKCCTSYVSCHSLLTFNQSLTWAA